jgi:crossover junction endodeoxyribonuclease RuvC
MKVVGVDPGITGALAVYDHGTLQSVHDMPCFDGQADANALGVLFDEWNPDMIAIEHVQPMPRNGTIASFSLGKNYGIVIGVAGALSHPLVKLRPSEWKRRMGLLKKPKQASQRLAIELWPDHAPMFRLAKHHNRAEAALIARAYAFQAVHQENAQ